MESLPVFCLYACVFDDESCKIGYHLTKQASKRDKFFPSRHFSHAAHSPGGADGKKKLLGSYGSLVNYVLEFHHGNLGLTQARIIHGEYDRSVALMVYTHTHTGLLHIFETQGQKGCGTLIPLKRSSRMTQHTNTHPKEIEQKY